MRKTIKLPAKNEYIAEIVDFIRNSLSETGATRDEKIRQCMKSEELVAKLIEKRTSENSFVSVRVTDLLGFVKIRITCPGEKFDVSELEYDYSEYISGEDDDSSLRAVGNLMNEMLMENLHIRNSRGHNVCTIDVAEAQYKQLILMVSFLFAGVIAGLIMKHTLPEVVASGIAEDVFATVSTMFINALKMIVAPLVFFSIASSIASFGNLKLLGKMAVKVVCMYLVTSAIAICVGFLTFRLFPIGEPALASFVTNAGDDAVTTSTEMTLSIKEVIMDIVPDNFMAPFLESSMLQIIFIAALFGVAAASIDEKYSWFRQGIKAANAIFTKITAIIVQFMPIAVFCAMAKLMIGMDFAKVATVALWIPVCYAGCIMMVLVYMLILIISGLNPIKFIKGYMPAALTAYSLASSNPSIPVSLDVCENRLGISKKLISFSIPLGATINMDGSCIILMISTLFMAKIFGVPIVGGTMLALVITIMMLSIGAPGVPGSTLVCLAFILPQVGIPADGISIVMGLYTLVGMAIAANNVTGDAVVSSIVAKQSGMLDLEVFNKK